MRFVLGCALVVGGVGSSVAEPLDEIFAGWAAAQGRAESLVVEFGLETKDLTFDQLEKASGALRLIRSKKGEVFASYEVAAEKPGGEKAQRLSGLLNGGKVYVLDHNKKIAMRFEFTDGESTPFLERHFNPFVVLLDRTHAESKCQLDVIKHDEWYTYLAVKPKQVKRFGSFPDNFHDGRVVLMRKDSEAVPKGMPRQLWHTDGIREYLFEMKAWRLNSAEGPKLEEFARPEDRPGWKVVDSPFQRKKQPGRPLPNQLLLSGYSTQGKARNFIRANQWQRPTARHGSMLGDGGAYPGRGETCSLEIARTCTSELTVSAITTDEWYTVSTP